MKYIKQLVIDIDKKNSEVIQSVQYDSNTRFLHINLVSNSMPFDISGCSVKVSGIKSDNTGVFNNCTVLNAKEGFVEVELTEQINAVEGLVKCELKIYDGRGVLTTKQFNINVTPSVSNKAIESSNEFGALTEALNKVNNIDNSFNNIELKINEMKEHCTGGNGMQSHSHVNKTLLDKFSEVDGVPYFNGNEIAGKIENGTITRNLLRDDISPDFLEGVNCEKSINLLNRNDISIGINVDGLGEEVVHTHSKYSGFISVDEGETYCRTLYPSNPAHYNEISLYDKDKKFLKKIGTTTVTNEYGTFVIPVGCAFIRVQFAISIENCMVVKGDVYPSSFNPYKKEFNLSNEWKISAESIKGKIKNDILELVTKVEGSKNILNLNDLIPNGNYNEANGEWRVDATTCSTNFIEIPNDALYISRLNDGTGGWTGTTFWNENKEYLTGGAGLQVVIPPKAKYVTCCIRNNVLETEMIIFGTKDEIPKEYEKFSPTYFKLSDEVRVENVESNIEISSTKNDNIPCLFITGDMTGMSKNTSKNLNVSYKSDNITLSGYCKMKWQGTSSISYPKKNFTITFYEDNNYSSKKGYLINPKWGEQNKYCLKANYIDHSHMRNIVSAKIWSEIVQDRDSYGNMPVEILTSPNNGAIDGFYIKMFINGEYQGLYTFNIPKDAWMFNMSDKNENHCILCGENYESGCFRALPKINGSDWSDELHDTTPDNIKTSWSNAISFVMNSSDTEFVNNLSNYFDIDSLIDYYIYAYVSCGLDSMGKNQIYFTCDGVKWFASMYDMDSTWGLYYNGSSFVSSQYRCQEDYESMIGGRLGNLLYIRLASLFEADILNRYNKLRNYVLSNENIKNNFISFDNVTQYLKHKDLDIFPSIPNSSKNNINQILSFIDERLAYCDSKFNI